MSILIKEAYANPTTQLWASAGGIIAPANTLVGTFVTTSPTYTFESGGSGDIYTLDSGLFADSGAYVATISFNVSISDYVYSSGSTNIPLVFIINYTNSIGVFYSGATFFTTQHLESSDITIVFPFVSDGSATNIPITLYNVSDYDSVSVNITTRSESLQFLSPSPTLVSAIFG